MPVPVLVQYEFCSNTDELMILPIPYGPEKSPIRNAMKGQLPGFSTRNLVRVWYVGLKSLGEVEKIIAHARMKTGISPNGTDRR